MGMTNSHVLWLIANRERIFRYFFIPQFIAAIPFLWFGYATGKVHTHLLFKGAATTGTVVAVVPVQFSSRSSSSLSSTAYESVVSFMAGNDEFRFQEWKATRFAPNIGTHVPVIYDPTDPDVAMVDRGGRNYLPWVPFSAIGIFLFLVALKGLLTLLFRR